LNDFPPEFVSAAFPPAILMTGGVATRSDMAFRASNSSGMFFAAPRFCVTLPPPHSCSMVPFHFVVACGDLSGCPPLRRALLSRFEFLRFFGSAGCSPFAQAFHT